MEKKTEIGKCAHCGMPIFEDHPYGWCMKCGEPVSKDIAIQLNEKMLNADLTAPIRVHVGAMKTLRFPDRCPCCMVRLTEKALCFDRLSSDKNPLGFFLSALSRTHYAVKIPYCKQCYAHIEMVRPPALITGLTMLLVLATVVGWAWYDNHHAVSFTAGIVFVLGIGVVLPWATYGLVLRPIRQKKAKKLTKNECCSTQASVEYFGSWELMFRNRVFGKEFASINGLRPT